MGKANPAEAQCQADVPTGDSPLLNAHGTGLKREAEWCNAVAFNTLQSQYLLLLTISCLKIIIMI